METKEIKNSLKHKLVKTKKGVTYHITIKLADECKNGHNDFSITANAYEAGKPTIDKYCVGGGAMGDELAVLFPELSIFNDLHLCDVNGAPMYAIENGFYFIQKEQKHIKSHFRVNDTEAEILKTAEDRQILAFMLKNMGLIERWKKEALKAIEILEELTGFKFEDNSTKIQNIYLDDVKENKIMQRIEKGFYSPEQIEERKEAKIKELKSKELKDIHQDYEKSCLKAFNEYLVKKAVLLAGLSIKNFIYYTHSNEGCFNWNTSSYNKEITEAEFLGFLDYIKLTSPELPKNITFKLK